MVQKIHERDQGLGARQKHVEELSRSGCTKVYRLIVVKNPAFVPQKIDSRVVEGDMVQPFITDGGADVLLPVWDAINPLLLSMFGQ